MKIVGVITISIIGLMFVGPSLQQSNEKVNFTLYYEPLCASSSDFIVEQLQRFYYQVGSLVNVTLNPYGNAHRKKVNGRWQFTCQHGEKECVMSKITACAIPHLTINKQLDFAACYTFPKDVESCISELPLNSTEIHNCANGTLGEELLAKYGEETDALNPPHTYVPYLVFNGVYNAELADKAREDFPRTVCSLSQAKHKPPICDYVGNDLEYLSSIKETEENLKVA